MTLPSVGKKFSQSQPIYVIRMNCLSMSKSYLSLASFEEIAFVLENS